MAQETPQSTPRTSPNTATRGAPPFLLKLYEIVDDQSIDDLIHWSPDGDSFFILERGRFSRELLDKWFKHKNYSSFIRQLNNYGFRKITHLQQGALRSDIASEFDHYIHTGSQFRRGQRDLLRHIQRSKDQRAPSGPLAPSPEACDPAPPTPIREIASAGDTSQDLLLKTILLDVGSLKQRQMELETDNRCLREEVGAMRQQLEFLLRHLTSSELSSMAGTHWTTRGNEPLLIQGTPSKVEVGEATDFDKWTDSPSDHYTVSSPPSSPPSAFSGTIDQEPYFNNPNGPTSTEGPHSPPPTSRTSSTSPPNLGEDLYKSIGDPEFSFGSQGTSPFDSSKSGYPNQAHDFPGDLTSSLFPSELHSSETHRNDYDIDNSNFVDSPVEGVRCCIPSYGMAENGVGSLYHSFSSLAESAGGVVTGSGMQPTSCAPTDTAVSVIGGKREASVMDDLERTGPECAPDTSPLSLSSYGTRPPDGFICPALLLPLNDQHWAPRNHLMPGPVFRFSGPEDDNRSPKRAKCTLESKGDNF